MELSLGAATQPEESVSRVVLLGDSSIKSLPFFPTILKLPASAGGESEMRK